MSVSRKRVDLTSQTFGRWTVLHEDPVSGLPPKFRRYWVCRCSCPAKTVKTVLQDTLKSGQSVSCGCLQKTGGKWKGASASHLPEFTAWRDMNRRCYDPENNRFQWYGAKGIGVCERWQTDFLAFFEDMGERPSAKHSLERLNTSADYGPGNCTWAEPLQQANNKTNNVRLEWQGESLTLAEWGRRLGVSPQMLAKRVARGWTTEQTLTAPWKHYCNPRRRE